jgi:hypothetical protein
MMFSFDDDCPAAMLPGPKRMVDRFVDFEEALYCHE